MSDSFYQELQFPYYQNSAVAVTLRGKVGEEVQLVTLSVSEFVQCVELAGLSGLFISDTGRGKTQLLTDIAWHHFGGWRGHASETPDGRNVQTTVACLQQADDFLSA